MKALLQKTPAVRPAYLEEMIGWYASSNVIAHLEALAIRQLEKNRLFIGRLERYLLPGSVLEFGAGIGQLCAILGSMGFDVTASEIHLHLVDYMRLKGLKASVVDARRARDYLSGNFDNVLAHGLHTLLTKNFEGTGETYRSAREVLRPGGRFIVVLANAYKPRKWSTMDSHLPFIQREGFRIIARFRDQVLPSLLYDRLPKFVLNALEYTVGRYVGIRHVLVLERPS